MWEWRDEKVTAFDFEASGTLPEYALQPWRVPQGKAWITSMSVIDYTADRLVPNGSKLFPTVKDMEAFLLRMIAEKRTVITWNGAYDIAMLVAHGLVNLVHKIHWLDGMLLWRHLEVEPEYEMMRTQRKSFALKPGGIQRFIPVAAGYEDDVDFHATDDESLAKLQKYNDRDSVHTWIIGKLIWDSLTAKQRQSALIQAESLSPAAEANAEGMLVDQLVAKELQAHLTDVADEMLEELKDHGVTETIVRSPTKLANLLFDQWKLPVIKENVGKKTKRVTRSTDKEVLHELSFRDDRAKKLRAFREALGNRKKFADTPIEAAVYNEDLRAHPEARVFGTYSGRFTYSSNQGKGKEQRQTGFALHQEKRDAFFRSILTAPPGYTLMEFDASGQEFRWMAILTGDPVMLNLCEDGEDPHSYMGSRIVGQDYKTLAAAAAKEDQAASDARQLGKVANLSLQYRTYPKTLRRVARVQWGIPMELPEAQRIHATYQQTYTGVPRYWEDKIRLAKVRGYAETLAGARVRLKGDWSGEWGWSMESTAINYPVQGTGAEQKYLAMKVLKDAWRELGARFAWDLHDGIYMLVPDGKVSEAHALISPLLDNLPYQQEWGFTPPIPMPWDCKVGKSWGTLKKWKG